MRTTNRRYVTESEIRAAKQIDLLTYLQTYEPNELVKDGSGYHTRTHDSLKISNGMWHWFSRGIGGRTALDYLMHVKGMDFVPAVQLLCGLGGILPPSPDKEGSCEHRDILPPSPGRERKEPKAFELPPAYPDCSRVTRYLRKRGISPEVLRRCIDEGALYEADRYHNAVFVGRDEGGTPRYAMQRSTGEKALKLEVDGSDKRYSFSLKGSGDMLIVSESAIDALSMATMMQQAGKPWRTYHYLSLGGVSIKKQSDVLPMALKQYLSDHPEIRRIRLALDNDRIGHGAAEQIMGALSDHYEISASFPKCGKDFNEQLQRMKQTHRER